MARLSAADERRALMSAAEWWERCRLIGGGNRQRGAVPLAAAERRGALRVDESCGLAKAGPMDKASSAADRPDEGAEAAAPLAAAPKKRTVRLREQRQRRKERQKDEDPEKASTSGCITAAPAAVVGGDHADADATMGDATSREQPQQRAGGSDGDGGAARAAQLHRGQLLTQVPASRLAQLQRTAPAQAPTTR